MKKTTKIGLGAVGAVLVLVIATSGDDSEPTTPAPATATVTQTVEAKPSPAPAPQPVKETPKPSPKPTQEPEPAPVISDSEIFEMAMQMTWDSMNATEQAEMCEAWDLLGPEWSLDMIAEGWNETSNGMPFDYGQARSFFTGKCG